MNDKMEMEGYGIYYLKDKNVLAEGIWKNNDIKYARIFLPNGDYYEGEMKNSAFDGKGTYFYNNGDKYSGNFSQGEKSGNGLYTYNDGTTYSGSIENDIYQGEGELKWKNITYNGQFNNGYIEGIGKLYDNKGESYEGNFNKNLYEGKGKYTYLDGSTYDGDFSANLRNGKGSYNDKTQNFTYDGEWVNDIPNGSGKLSYNSALCSCTWKNGKIIEGPNYETGSNIPEQILNFTPQFGTLNLSNLNHISNTNLQDSQYYAEGSPSFLENEE